VHWLAANREQLVAHLHEPQPLLLLLLLLLLLEGALQH
jgi:hypothetical protein